MRQNYQNLRKIIVEHALLRVKLLDISCDCDLTEIQWRISDHFLSDTNAAKFSGRYSSSANGIVFIFQKNLKSCEIGDEMTSDRMMGIKLRMAQENLNIKQSYDSDDEDNVKC